MNMSKKGMELLKTNESFRSEPYPDAGHMSIGYGHQIQPGENLTHIDEKTANELLQQDVKKAENLVKNNIKVPLLQNQFDGLVDFAYNMPGGISSIAQNVNRGDIPGAAERMKLYNKSKEKGKLIVNQGLIGRRNTESAEFLGITPESTATALKPPAPQTGRGILDATKHNEDIKAQQANNQNGNTIVAPTTNNSTTTAHLSMPQQDPQNTDNTFRDARHRNQFSG
jgi:GH24 family phage-related lysozyme (muramidase)